MISKELKEKVENMTDAEFASFARKVKDHQPTEGSLCALMRGGVCCLVRAANWANKWQTGSYMLGASATRYVDGFEMRPEDVYIELNF